MKNIMQMVQDNSQLSCVFGIFINSVNNQPSYVQMVLNSDDESLMMFVISNFTSMDCKCIALDELSHPLWHMITHRFGGNTYICTKTNTLIMSLENQLFGQLIINGVIEEIDISAPASDFGF